MEYLWIVLSGVMVALDAAFLGFSYSIKNTISKLNLLIIGLTTTVMCVVSMLIGSKLINYINETNIVAGILLIIVGLKNLFSKDNSDKLAKLQKKIDILALSVSIGVDASILALTYAASGINNFNYVFIPLVFGLLHILMVLFGNKVATSKIKKFFIKFSFLPSLIIIVFGISKFWA